MALHHVSGDLAHIVANKLGAGGDAGIEGQGLGGGSISKRALSGLGSLLKLGAEGAILIPDVHGKDLSAGGADSLISGLGRAVRSADGDEVSPEDISGGVVELAAGLQLKQAVGDHAVGAAEGNGLISLDQAKTTAMLTGDLSGLFGLRHAHTLQLVKSELERAGGDIKDAHGLDAGDGNITNNHKHFLLYYL